MCSRASAAWIGHRVAHGVLRAPADTTGLTTSSPRSGRRITSSPGSSQVVGTTGRPACLQVAQVPFVDVPLERRRRSSRVVERSDDAPQPIGRTRRGAAHSPTWSAPPRDRTPTSRPLRSSHATTLASTPLQISASSSGVSSSSAAAGGNSAVTSATRVIARRAPSSRRGQLHGLITLDAVTGLGDGVHLTVVG